MDRVEIAVQLRGPARTEMFLGREHLVVPATLVQSQILQNNLGKTFLPASEITPEWAETANGSPVVVDHPTRQGHAVTAKSPDVMNARGVGFLFARAENGALKGDVFLDPARADAVEGLKVILERVRKGEPVELSTGFPVLVESSPGVHNGQSYDKVLRPRGFDHLAVFADKIGACSVQDGCGLGINHAGDCEMADNDRPDSALDFSELPPADSPAAAARDSFWKKILQNALRAVGREQEGPSSAPEKEPASNEPGDHHPQETDMNREQMIAQLVQNGRKKEALDGLSDCDLKTLLGANAQPTPKDDPEEVAILQTRIHELRTQLEQTQAETATALQAEKKEKLDKQEELIHAANTAYSPNEIRAMDIKQVRKLYDTVFPRRADFSGRPVPRAQNSSAFDASFAQRPILGGRPGESALNRKEN